MEEHNQFNSDVVDSVVSKRTAIIVLGMHRSGTSAWTRCLNLLGAELPRHVFGAGSGNKTGHWEAEYLIEINNQLLASCGSRWDDWREVDLTRLSKDEYVKYSSKISEAIKAEYSGSSLLLLKDPRICRLAAIYKDVFKALDIDVKFLIPYRDPLSVIDSLKMRDQMTSDFSAALWLRHILDALRFSDGESRAVISYEGLLADWRASVRAVESELALKFDGVSDSKIEQLEDFLSPELQHHRSSINHIGCSSRLVEWVKTIYSALQKYEASSKSKSAAKMVSSVRSDFDQVCSVMGGAIFEELSARENKYSEQALDQIKLLTSTQNELLERESEIERKGRERREIEQKLSEYGKALKQSSVESQSLRDRLEIFERSYFIRSCVWLRYSAGRVINMFLKR